MSEIYDLKKSCHWYIYIYIATSSDDSVTNLLQLHCRGVIDNDALSVGLQGLEPMPPTLNRKSK